MMSIFKVLSPSVYYEILCLLVADVTNFMLVYILFEFVTF